MKSPLKALPYFLLSITCLEAVPIDANEAIEDVFTARNLRAERV